MATRTKHVQFNVNIREETRDRLKDLIPEGMTSSVMQTWLDTLIPLLQDKDGFAILGMLAKGEVLPNQLFSLSGKE